MSSQRIPTYRLHKGTGQAVVTLNGHDHYLGLHDTDRSRERYRALIAEWLLNQGRPPTPENPALVSVNQVLYAYWLFAQQYYRKDGQPTGQLSRIKVAFRPLRELYGSRPAPEIGPRELKAVREEMLRRDWERGFINAAVGVLKRTWRWAGEEGMIPASNWHGLAVVKNLARGRSSAREAPDILPVPWAVVEATLPYLNEVVRSMVQVQYLAGMRPCEIRHLKGTDIDQTGQLPGGQFADKVWVVHVSDQGNKLAHKGIDRTCFFGPSAQDILRTFLVRHRTDHLFSPRDVPRSRGKKISGHYSRHSYLTAILRAAAKAGVEPWCPLQLRHSRATEIRKQFGLKAASEVLGHEHLETSLIYAERDLGNAAEIMRRIG